MKIHPLVCATPENSFQLQDVLGRERRGRADTSGTVRQNCTAGKEQDVILPAQLPFKCLMPERRRWEDLLLSVVCLSVAQPGKLTGRVALLPGVSRVLNLPALQAQRDKLAQAALGW